MFSKDYMWAGIASIAAMIMFPCYFIYAAGSWDNPSAEFARAQMALTISDWVFLALGALLIYVYHSLKRILNDHHNFHGIDVPIYMTMITLALLHGGMFIMDAVGTLLWDRLGSSGLDSMVNITTTLFVVSMLVFGIIDLIMGIILWRNRKRLPGMLFGFAVICLIMSPFELSVIFSFITIIAYPMALALLAVAFLRKPSVIEVV
jgi:hypothetical protein